MKKLAIITTHPIQYYAPLFRLLHQRGNILIKVFYTAGSGDKYDPGFGKNVAWDIPLLENYPYEWAGNIAKKPGSNHFNGVITPGLNKQVNNWQPDAILIFGWAYNGHLKLIRHFKKKVPLYFRGDSTLLNEPKGIKKTLKYFFLRWVYSHFDHAFYVGKNNKAYFLKYGLKESQLSFAPHAIDNERFEIPRTEEAKALSAFIKLNKPGVHLLMAGNGIDEIKLKKMAADSDISSHIHFMDFKNQSYMPVLYQAADLFCLPSKSETWGLSINEAMACGRAILASDRVGCAADLVQAAENGYVFKTADVGHLEECLQLLTKDKDLLAKFGKRSNSIIKDWNFEKTAIKIEEKLLQMTDKAR
jgi:glycosyltransferase involved in cell wall biosynthesis